MNKKTQKMMWSVPLIAAVAVIGALAIFMTLTPNSALADEPPIAVTGLKAAADGRSAVNLTWTAPSTGTVTGYRIDRADADARVWMVLVANTGDTATSYKDTYKLKASSNYNYRVYALNGDHTGPVSINPIYATVFTGAAEKPGQATGLTASRGLSQKITLKWNQPDDNGGADVSRYCIQVRQVNPAGNFGALTGCSGTATASTSDAIDAVATGVSGTTAYAGGLIVVEASSVEAEGGTATWDHKSTSFGDGVRVEYRVTAANSQGYSVNSSNTAEGETGMAPSPGMPTNIKLVGVDSNTAVNAVDGSNHDPEVYLYWSQPAGLPDGDNAFTLEVQRRIFAPASGWNPATWDNAANLNPGTLGQHAQFHNVLPDTSDTGRVRYRIRYKVGEREGNWAYSSELSLPFPVASDGNDDSLPIITTGASNLRVIDTSKYLNRIDLRWARETFCSQGNGTACGTNKTVSTSTYAIDVVNNKSATAPAADAGEGTGSAPLKWDRLTPTISFSDTRYRHLSNNTAKDATKLESDEDRHYRVFPWYAGRYGFPAVVSGKTKLANVPGGIAKGGLRINPDGATKLKLDWDAPSDTGGSPVTHYLIQVSNDRDNDATLTGGETFANWCDVTLRNAFLMTEDGRKVEVPRTYTYTGKIASTAKGTGVCSGSVAPLDATGEKLKAGYARWFRVIPLNKKSNDPPDSASSGWTVDTDAEPRATLSGGELRAESINTAIPARGVTGSTTAPTAPIGLVAETAKNVHSLLTTQKGVLLTWATPAEGGVTSYIIDRKIDGGAWVNLQAERSSSSTDWTDPKIPTATERFAYRVAARNEHGVSPWSNVSYYSSTSMTGMHTHNTDPAANDMEIDRVTVRAGEDSDPIDVSVYFSDADGDTLTYRSIYSDDQILTSSIPTGSSMLTITGVGAGEGTVKVYASDGMGGTDAMRTINVTVTPANMPPTKVGEIADIDVKVGQTHTSEMAASTYFADPDLTEPGAMLTITAASSDDEIATVEIDTDGKIAVTGKGAGTATITVTATDAGGLTADQTFTATVTPANMPPMPATDPGDQLPSSVSLTVGGDDEVLTLTDSFTDPDGDALIYTAMSDNAAATATVSDDGTMLTIAAVEAGEATVTVTATDPSGLSAKHEIDVMVTLPLALTEVNPVGSGIVTAAWNLVAGATGYALVASPLDAEPKNPNPIIRDLTNDKNAKSGQLIGLTVDEEYLIFVVSFDDAGGYEVSDHVRITAE